MTTKNTHYCALAPATIKRLNEQVAMEGAACAYYRAMASWCEVKGYEHSATLLHQHATEENEHMLRLFTYINDLGGHALQPEITDIQHEFASLKDVFETALSHEIKVTKAIHALVDYCLAEKDYATFNFLQWYVAEQIEEETLCRKALEFFDVIGEAGIGLYLIDKEIGKLAKKDE